jgi:acetyl-CoA acetyltransferase
MSYPALKKVVAISGAGQSAVGRPSPKSALALTVDTCLAAIADAGLSVDDIDGLSTYPGAIDNGSGFAPIGISETRVALNLKLTWTSGSALDGPGHMSAIFNAIAAISAGLVRHVLVFRTVAEATARAKVHHAGVVGGGVNAAARIWGANQWTIPYNALNACPWFAVFAQRHFHQYGTTSEQLGQVAINGRRMAALNPNAIYRAPITIDDYLAAPFIATPLRRLDCDAHIDGSTALVLSHVDAARDLRNPPIIIDGMGSAIHRGGYVSPDDFTSLGCEQAADMMWSQTDLKPKDIDVAQIYDGFSVLTLLWLEALGFCKKGEGGDFLQGGTRIGLDGELPMNTSGGQLSAGRFHGYGHTFEACQQLWGRAGQRQVPDARTTVVSNGGVGLGCLVLRRD